jgi:hypothetical protein
MPALLRAGMYCFMVLFFSVCMQGNGAQGATDGGVLVIKNSRTGNRYEIPFGESTVFTIRFFHSYDRQWVEESFRIENKVFIPSEVVFKDDSYDYRHQRYQCRQIVGSDKIDMVDIKPLPSDRLRRIITRVAYTRSQELILNGDRERHVYQFYEWGQPGQRLTFFVR